MYILTWCTGAPSPAGGKLRLDLCRHIFEQVNLRSDPYLNPVSALDYPVTGLQDFHPLWDNRSSDLERPWPMRDSKDDIDVK